MNSAVINNGVVGQIRSATDGAPGSVLVPDYVREGDTFENGKYLRGGIEIVPLLYPVTKLDIKSRVTAQEWTALKAAIATDPDATENWELANTIDPEHPQTKQVIAYLQSQNALTTPLWEIFAP